MTTSPPPLLAALDLRIGQTVQIIQRAPREAKHYTQLIGFVEHEFIMVRVPKAGGWPVQFSEGQALEMRVFSGVSLHEFESHLIALLHHPRNYMTLGCPTSIRTTALRSHERVRCALPLRVLSDAANQAYPEGYAFHDLSGSGAALVGSHALGDVGDRVRLDVAFWLRATATNESVQVDGVIQSVQQFRNQDGEITGYHHGIRFERVEPRILLLVYELLHPGR